LASDDDGKTVEVLDPLPSGDAGGTAEVLALIAHYTERPDLLLETVEKHDPGFIKRMNQNAERNSEEFRRSRFLFGRNQAYATLVVQVLAALAVLFFIWTALDQKVLNFWMLLGFAVVYAVAQGGRSGFLEVARGLASLLGNKGNDKPKGD
jgi:hypothetical protein